MPSVRARNFGLFVAVMFALVSLGFAAQARAEDAASRLLPNDPAIGPMVAKRSKKKKRKKKEDDGEEDGGGSGGLHAAQDGGKPEAPYKWEASLLSDFYRETHTVGGNSSGSGNYNLDATGLYVLSNLIEVGPRLVYDESATKAGDTTSTTRTYGIAAVGKFNFGDINRDEHLFFAKLYFGFGSSSVKAGDADAVSTSQTRYGLGGGFHYFVDSNVAITAEISYEGGSDKPKEGDAVSVTKIHFMRVGFSLFL